MKRLKSPTTALTKKEASLVKAEFQLTGQDVKAKLVALFQQIADEFADWKPDYDPPHRLIFQTMRKVGLKDVTVNSLSEEEFYRKEEKLADELSSKYYGDKVVVRHKYFTAVFAFPEMNELHLTRITLGERTIKK